MGVHDSTIPMGVHDFLRFPDATMYDLWGGRAPARPFSGDGAVYSAAILRRLPRIF